MKNLLPLLCIVILGVVRSFAQINELGEEIARIKHTEKSGFVWYELQTKCLDSYSKNLIDSHALDKNGNFITPPSKIGGLSLVYFVDNKYNGGYFVRVIDHPIDFKKLRDRTGAARVSEVYSKEGNIIIPYTRYYTSIHSSGNQVETNKYILFQNDNEFGLCDLNGAEIAKGNFEAFSYDGYTFIGYKENGSLVKKDIHKKPTAQQERQISNWGGYYSNMPWLMMPGPQYTPTWNINWNTNIDWSSIPIYGGIGDYVISEPNQIEESKPSSSDGSISSRKCAFCDGTGKKEVSQSIATFGTTDVKIHCNECGRDFYRSSGHSHVYCGHCGGTGHMK